MERRCPLCTAVGASTSRPFFRPDRNVRPAEQTWRSALLSYLSSWSPGLGAGAKRSQTTSGGGLITARRFPLTFGDVLGAVALLVGICVSAWTTLVLFSLLFPARAARAASSIRTSAGSMGLRGFGIALVVVVAILALAQYQLPITKLAITGILLALLSLAALGASGLAMLAADRVLENEPNLSPYAALMRGAALVVVPGLLPVFGWFLVAPAMLFVGIGAGTRALRLATPPVQG